MSIPRARERSKVSVDLYRSSGPAVRRTEPFLGLRVVPRNLRFRATGLKDLARRHEVKLCDSLLDPELMDKAARFRAWLLRQ